MKTKYKEFYLILFVIDQIDLKVILRVKLVGVVVAVLMKDE